MSNRGRPFPPEMRERAVRMVLEHQEESETQWEAIRSVAEKIGASSETVHSGCAARKSMAGACRPHERGA